MAARSGSPSTGGDIAKIGSWRGVPGNGAVSPLTAICDLSRIARKNSSVGNFSAGGGSLAWTHHEAEFSTDAASSVRATENPMLVLYDFGNSVCCQKVRITLRAKGLEWTARRVDLFKAEQYDPEYLRLNPKGVVPTLVHDGRAVIESTLICEYLDETFPEPGLMPADPHARARMRLWSKMVDEGLHEGVTEISFSAMFRERMRNAPPELRERRFRNVGDPRRRDRFQSTYELGVDSPFVLHAVAAYERAFGQLERTLAEGGPWILGDRVSLADVNLMPYAARLDYLGLLDVWTAGRARVCEWWGRAQEWPAYRAGLRDLLSEAEIEEMRIHGPRIRYRIAALRESVMA